MNNITTWRQGRFIDQRQYKNWSPEQKAQADHDEKVKVRPSPTGNAICLCSNPEDAKWVADRLNLAAKLSHEEQRVFALLKMCGIPQERAGTISNGIDVLITRYIKEIHSHMYNKEQQPPIVCLCGSTKFKEAFEKANQKFTLEGYIVLSVGVFAHGTDLQISADEKDVLDELHKRKIDMADKVFVVNVDGYIGESTRSEIQYAKQLTKPIEYLEPKHAVMDIHQAVTRMRENPGLKMTMPQHYRSYEYNYYDEKTKKFLTESGDEWDIERSISNNEMFGYEDWISK